MAFFDKIDKDRIIEVKKYYSKKTGYVKNVSYICKCPNYNVCKNTVSIGSNSQLHTKCISCSHREISHEEKDISQWQILTTDISKVRSNVELLEKDRFIQEEINQKGIVRLKIRCLETNCNNYVFIKCATHVQLQKSRCYECANFLRRKRPYERLYNKKLSDGPREKRNGSSIEWKMSYEEFASLCEMQNCHYCNNPLNRAKYRGDEGSTSLLLDRKDSNLDYTLLNCVPCCAVCNNTKGELISYDEMIMLMKYRGLWVEDKG